MLHPRQLEAFRSVMMRGSVTAAARDLRITQPAVSRLLRDFEARTGLRLFERHGNHLVPTPEASLLLGEVDRHFMGLDAISAFAAELKLGRRGSLRVVALPAMAMGFLPRFMADFVADRRLEGIFVHGMPSHLVIEAVAAGQAEIGFAATPMERPGLTIESLMTQAVLAVPERHKLACRSSASLEDLEGESFISLAEPLIFAAGIESVLAAVTRRVAAVTPLSGIACSLVAAGMGIALVDPFAASDFEGRGVVAIAFKPAIDIRVATVTSAHRRLSGIAQEFRDSFRAHVATFRASRPMAAKLARKASGRRRR